MAAKRFKFSVIITIYNTEKYLEEAIESVINQSIGFEKNIQLILVNNGSEDGSGAICERYRELYPDNIVYVHLRENAEPTGGRNAGIPHILGEFVNFLDSDDKWSEKAFERVYDFFCEVDDAVDVATCMLKNFERDENVHPLQHKFSKKNKIINIFLDYQNIAMHISSSFIRATEIKKYSFDRRMYSAEDGLLINQIILKKGAYGAMSSDIYYGYRKRNDGTSRVDSFIREKRYFLSDVKILCETLTTASINLFGVVIPYIQFFLMYVMQWRLREPVTILSSEEVEEFKDVMRNAYAYIDDEIIMEGQNMPLEYKALALRLKHGEDYLETASLERLAQLRIINPRSWKNFQLKVLEIENEKLILDGLTTIVLKEGAYHFVIKDEEGNVYELEHVPAYDEESIGFGEVFYSKKGFHIELPADKNRVYTCYLSIGDCVFEEEIACGKWSKLTSAMENSYYYRDKIAVLHDGKRLCVDVTRSKLELEEHYLNELNEKGLAAIYYMRKAAALLKVSKEFENREIWICGDRFYSADDNGEVFYNWVQKNGDKGINCFYAINKDSKDFERLSVRDNIIEANSNEYKLLFLAADYRINSAMDGYLYEPFGKDEKYFRDLYPEFIYLEHGTVEKDLSGIEKKFRKNFRIYNTSSQEEYDWFLKYNYGYTEREMRLSGMPRYDIINEIREEKKEKSIVFAPTWRGSLRIKTDSVTGKPVYNEHFIESDFFRFYNSLINDERITEALKNNGYKAYLRLHPVFKVQAQDFNLNELFSLQEDMSYIDQFKAARLLITDYSSIAFDYAYSGAAVIYGQFDKEEFYSNHIYDEGFFDYEKEGFGPVCYDYESLVSAIVRIVNNDCLVDQEYDARVKQFFKYFNGKNCERIYNDIRSLKKN